MKKSFFYLGIAYLSLLAISTTRQSDNMNYQTLTDEQLVAGLRNSKIAAFDAIYARYWKLLYAVAYSQLGTKEEAEDIVQTVFERIWHNREIQKINCLKAYLIVLVRHFAINYIKSQITYRKFQEYLIFQEIQKSFSSFCRKY